MANASWEEGLREPRAKVEDQMRHFLRVVLGLMGSRKEVPGQEHQFGSCICSRRVGLGLQGRHLGLGLEWEVARPGAVVVLAGMGERRGPAAASAGASGSAAVAASSSSSSGSGHIFKIRM